jgi:GNAT superfamily N-acetyltransferase
VVRERGEPWRVEGYVHPDAHGRGIGRLIATELEADAARRGARRIQNPILEADAGAGRLLESLGYAAVRLSRDAHRAQHAAARTRVAGRAARRPV